MKPLVLVVDDDPQMLKVIAHMLAREPIEVQTAQDAFSGLARVAQRAPDLLIVDMLLEGMQGLQTLRMLRGERDTPAIAISGAFVDPEAMRSYGFDAFLQKPFTGDQLRSAVAEALGQKER